MSALEFETADDLRAIVTPGLRLAFRWTGDRWTHALEGGPESGRFVLAQAVESDELSRVVSPAYQQFHSQRTPEAVQAMLVGQSGPHHFSAVFTVRELPDGTEVAVDVADRCRADVEALACTYQVLIDAAELMTADPSQIVWNDRGRLAFSASVPGSICLSESGRRFSLVQAVARIDHACHTQRLLYHWKWLPR